MKPVRSLWLGRRDYVEVWQSMRAFTDQREAREADQIWALEHPPVFTQGQRGASEHLLDAGNIPVVPTDRGGQITYHGPGQLVVYPLLNIRRLGLGARGLVIALENAMIDCLAEFGITATGNRDAPGVYVQGKKIGSIGMRIRRGCCYHGLALNVAMDLEPFQRINPCGFAGLQVTQVSTLGGPADPRQVAQQLLPQLGQHLNLSHAGWENAGDGALISS